MNPAKKYLCLFSSPDLLSRSCFPEGRGWTEATDQGRVEFVPHVLDGELPVLLASGLFAASTFLIRSADLDGDGLLEGLRQGVQAFRAPERSIELSAAESPIDLLAWLTRCAPDLVDVYRQDGEVRYGYPSWWRGRAELHFSGGISSAGALDQSDSDVDSTALRDFIAKRRGR